MIENKEIYEFIKMMKKYNLKMLTIVFNDDSCYDIIELSEWEYRICRKDCSCTNFVVVEEENE